ncbi:hypothetical protein JTB14_038463 [Gonioctena quinquepunctata]|nr:hypothetical protein JTB14_038463 [Gonioctena quinquepunctata]
MLVANCGHKLNIQDNIPLTELYDELIEANRQQTLQKHITSKISDKQKLRNPKSHSVFIADDMCIEYREDQKLLEEYLLLTRKYDQSAKIQNFKLVFVGKQYTISRLREREKKEQVESDSEEEEGEEERTE